MFLLYILTTTTRKMSTNVQFFSHLKTFSVCCVLKFPSKLIWLFHIVSDSSSSSSLILMVRSFRFFWFTINFSSVGLISTLNAHKHTHTQLENRELSSKHNHHSLTRTPFYVRNWEKQIKTKKQFRRIPDNWI